MSFRSRFPLIWLKTLLFLAVPLLLELLAYLLRGDIYPRYLPVSTQVSNLTLIFFYYAILYAGISLLAAIFFTFVPIQVEVILPCLLFAAFLALTLCRLLPHDSGFSIPRILVVSVSLLLACGMFFLIKRQKFLAVRLFIATSLYCFTAGHLLPHLFQFPVSNVFYALITHVVLISLLLFLPGKILAGVIVFAIVLLFQLRTPLQRFASPQKMPAYNRVILVGIDGLSPEIAFTMARQGKLPAVRKIMENGVYGRLHTLYVPFSPLVWNTIYTGVEPRWHGIMAFTFTGVAGSSPFLSLWLDNWSNSDWMHRANGVLKHLHAIQTLYPSLSKNRLRPALWNIANQNNADALVLGGWNTYPPEKIRGLYVSDYALTRQSNLVGSYYPASKKLNELLAFSPDVSSWPSDLQRYLSKDEKTHYLWRNLISDCGQDTRLITTYYYSPDAFGHHYGTYIDRNSTSDSDRSNYLEIEDKVYRNVDRLLQDYLEDLEDRTLLIICSDHGFHYDKRQHNYPVEGTILMFGKGVRKAMSVEAGVYSIAPTITYALGIAPDSRFRDTPLRQAFEGIMDEVPSRQYKTNNQFFETTTEKGFEREKLEELLDLQYIK
jgi:Type I phosphodiesterase / nucleotide pyrophosphatase